MDSATETKKKLYINCEIATQFLKKLANYEIFKKMNESIKNKLKVIKNYFVIIF